MFTCKHSFTLKEECNIIIDREAREIMYLVASVRLSVCLLVSTLLTLEAYVTKSLLTGLTNPEN